MGRSAGWSNTACEEAENWKFCENERAQKRLRMEGCYEKYGNGDKRKKLGDRSPSRGKGEGSMAVVALTEFVLIFFKNVVFEFVSVVSCSAG